MAKISFEVDVKDLFFGDPDNEGGYQSDYDNYESLRQRVEDKVVDRIANNVMAHINQPMPAMARAIERIAGEAFDEIAREKLEAALRQGAADAWGFKDEAELDHWIANNLRARICAPVDLGRM